MNKYFLKDGCYEWSNIVTLSGIYDFGHMGCPVKLNFTLGYVYDFFTDTNAAIGTEGNFSVIDNAEYPSSSGIVASIGFTIFAR